MQSSIRLSLLFALLLGVTACGGNDASTTDAGTDAANADAASESAPVPGTLSAGNPTSSTIDLTWTAATDDTTAAAALEYRVYFSEADDLSTVDEVLANGTEVNDWTAGITSLTAGSLALGTAHHFNVLVRDEAGNVAAYGGASATTLGGTWDDEAPIDLGGASAYYSTLSASSRGDVVLRWDQTPTWGVHYALRGHEAEAFGDPDAWGEAGRGTSRLDYGFDDVVVGATVTHNEDDTADVTFERLVDAEVARDPIVSGAVDGYWVVSRACVASNGDAMAVWIDGPSSGMLAVRARFRTGGTWGGATLVSATATADVSTLEVVCSPDGDHVVFYGEQTAGDRALMARVYDATQGAFAGPAVPLSTDDFQYSLSAVRTEDGRVVAAWSEHDGDTTTSFVARVLDGGAWSTPADTLASSGSGALTSLTVVAAADDVHAIWYAAPTAIRTRRLAAGASSWTAADALAEISTFQELRASGNRVGDVVLMWVTGNAIHARFYSASAGAWGTATPLKEDAAQIGSGSTSAVIDARRRATVAWTVWDPMAAAMILRTRTFR